MIDCILSNTREELKTLPLKDYAKRKAVSDIKANLSLNINPYGLSKKVKKKLAGLSSTKIVNYYPENKKLRNLISNYLNVQEENILLGAGCDGCLEMIVKTFISKNDSVIIPIPTFHRYEFHTKLMGGKCLFIPMNNFKLDADSVLKKAKAADAKIIFLCNPNNPTGTEIELAEQTKILNFFPGLVVIDEALADATNINGGRLIKKYKNLIVVRSFSKLFGLASLRAGYIVADQKIISAIKKVSSPFQVNGVAQELAIIALRDTDHINNTKKYIESEREQLTTQLEQLGCPCTKSSTTNFLAK